VSGRARLVLISAVAAFISGCTQPSAGSAVLPEPGSGTTSGEPTATSAPARPRELRLDGKEPCGLVPRTDWAKFDIDEPGTSRQDDIFKSPSCFYGTNTGGVELILVVTEGIERWTDGSRRGVAHETAPVAGFPAITVNKPGEKDACDVAVDVAKGQYLFATKMVISDRAETLPAPCDWAHQLAESAMKTLLAS
jgi:hypothetical protein